VAAAAAVAAMEAVRAVDEREGESAEGSDESSSDSSGSGLRRHEIKKKERLSGALEWEESQGSLLGDRSCGVEDGRREGNKSRMHRQRKPAPNSAHLNPLASSLPSKRVNSRDANQNKEQGLQGQQDFSQEGGLLRTPPPQNAPAVQPSLSPPSSESTPRQSPSQMPQGACRLQENKFHIYISKFLFSHYTRAHIHAHIHACIH
jgi:hypothetical protein